MGGIAFPEVHFLLGDVFYLEVLLVAECVGGDEMQIAGRGPDDAVLTLAEFAHTSHCAPLRTMRVDNNILLLDGQVFLELIPII